MGESKDVSKKSVFITRTLSGVVFATVVVGAILLSKYTLLALMLAILVGSILEFYNISKLDGARPIRSYGVVVGVAIVVVTFLAVGGVLSENVEMKLSAFMRPGVLIAAFISLIFIPFVVELYRKNEHPIYSIASTLMGLIYVAIPVALLSIIPTFSDDKYSGWLLLCYIFIVWGNDVGAYLFGVTFGKHKLFERISPNKSWEGFFGGVLTAIGVGVLSGYLLNQSIIFWGGLAVVVAVSGVYGDLVESMFKRTVGVKDSGRMMPGHGGFLDRFDALILSAPYVFLYFTIFA